jgi:hypothetical protein
MTTKSQQGQGRDKERFERDSLHTRIGQKILSTLGRPGDVHAVQVRHLWEDNYRVNVLVGPSAAAARVAHSYFVVVNGEGDIVTAAPVIAPRY